jgi:hypothetical protein
MRWSNLGPLELYIILTTSPYRNQGHGYGHVKCRQSKIACRWSFEKKFPHHPLWGYFMYKFIEWLGTNNIHQIYCEYITKALLKITYPIGKLREIWWEFIGNETFQQTKLSKWGTQLLFSTENIYRQIIINFFVLKKPIRRQLAKHRII